MLHTRTVHSVDCVVHVCALISIASVCRMRLFVHQFVAAYPPFARSLPPSLPPSTHPPSLSGVLYLSVEERDEVGTVFAFESEAPMSSVFETHFWRLAVLAHWQRLEQGRVRHEAAASSMQQPGCMHLAQGVMREKRRQASRRDKR